MGIPTSSPPKSVTVSKPNTIRAYRDAFSCSCCYCRDVRRLAPNRLSLEQIDPSLVLDFLDHLEKERRVLARLRTRNLRLTAVHAFLYLQTEMGLLRCQRILAIPLQRLAPRLWSTSRRRSWPPSSTSRTWATCAGGAMPSS